MSEERTNISEEGAGMSIYDYIVNHVDAIDGELPELTDRLVGADNSGQFLASSARFLYAVDRERFHDSIGRLVEAAISKDRERRYISSLLEALWGADYAERAEELSNTDDNFRRIYKRIFPQTLNSRI